MRDIFNLSPGQYSYLQRMGDAAAQRAYLRQRAAQRGAQPHNFDNPRLPLHDARGGLLNDSEFQAQSLAFVTNNQEALMSRIEEVLYTRSRYQNLIAIDTSVPEGAQSYAYRVIDRFGRGRRIGPRGDDAPAAMVSQRKVPYELFYNGMVPEWTVEDLRVSRYGGVALDMETIDAGTIGCLNHIEETVISGEPETSETGLINNADVPTQSLSQTIAAMDPDEIIEFLQEEATDAIARTSEVVGGQLTSPMIFYMPYSQAGRMTTLRTYRDLSVWEAFAMTNSYTQMTGMRPQLVWLQELNNAGAATTDRIVCGFRDLRIAQFAIPIRPRILSIMPEGYRICAYMEYKISGVNFLRPDCFRYSDGA